jgi:hypothetical protein
MDALFENRNFLGYVLLVALAAVIILRLQARRRGGGGAAGRRPALERLAELRGRERGEAAEPAGGIAAPGKPMSFSAARLQFYVMLAAAVALVIGYLAHLWR